VSFAKEEPQCLEGSRGKPRVSFSVVVFFRKSSFSGSLEEAS
jgi:hypothetical protein